MRFGLAFALVCVASASDAATFTLDLSSAVFSAGSTSISAEVGGVTVTGQGFVVEVADGPEEVFGPFPVVTSAAQSGLGLYPFGIGLRAGSTGDIALNGRDLGFGNNAPGFNGYYIDDFGVPKSKTDFLMLTFSAPVNIGSVIVDDVSNFNRSVWMAYGTALPDFSSGFLSALEGLTVKNSADDTTDGLFSHALGASSVTTLLIGAPFRSGPYGPISGPDSQFYIVGLGDVSLAAGPDDGGGNGGGGPDPELPPIPLPSSVLLMGAALLALLRIGKPSPAV